MLSRDDIRNGRGRGRRPSVEEQQTSTNSSPYLSNYRCCICTFSLCCCFWFIISCVFAGTFGWAFSEWKRAENKLRHDPLTDVLSLSECKRRYDKMGSRTSDGQDICFCFLDIRNMHCYNNQCGHSYGDKIITSFASMIGENTRKADITCRYSNAADEFLLLGPTHSDQNGCAKFDEKLTDRIGDEIPFRIGCVTNGYESNTPFDSLRERAENKKNENPASTEECSCSNI